MNEFRLPGGLRIRPAMPADAAGLARVHVDSWRATYRGIVPDAHLDQLAYEPRARRWAAQLEETGSTDFTDVVELPSGQLVGFATSGPEREGDPIYRGELYGIYLLPAHQRQGIGRRLAARAAERLAAAGIRSLLVWVLEANAACRFYEALGGQRLRESPITIGGAPLVKVAYGWPDTRGLREG
jgi:ribosomal protein S18 acetylase RimI-like enzyme